MKNILEGTGLFIYPLLLCSMVALFIFIERWIALKRASIIPTKYWKILSEDSVIDNKGDSNSVAGRIFSFFSGNNSDVETLKAYVQLEVTRMERGLFLIDAIVSIAPLLGLLGTVVGLFQVFSHLSVTEGMPETVNFVKGIALALTTTMLGLFIAIPSVFGSSYLSRKVEIYAAQINVLAEKLIKQNQA